MSRLRRWLLKKVIGHRMVVANTVRDQAGSLAPRHYGSSALVFGNLFCEIDPRLAFRISGRNRLERWLIKIVGPAILERLWTKAPALHFRADDNATIEDCTFWGVRIEWEDAH